MGPCAMEFLRVDATAAASRIKLTLGTPAHTHWKKKLSKRSVWRTGCYGPDSTLCHGPCGRAPAHLDCIQIDPGAVNMVRRVVFLTR